jgi:3',5'-cyclic AMP phosphodiesterase CpdA
VSVLVQISDPHFGTEQPHVVEGLIRFVRETTPDVVVLSGDITQRGRRSQFDAAKAFVERLAAPVTLAIPGNHDIPLFNLALRALAPYGNYARTFGADLEPHWSSPSMLVICVNTTRPSRHKDGEVSAGQIARVAEKLRAATAEQLRIVVTHQPVHVIHEHDLENLLHGHVAAVNAWARAGADIIMGGHIHLPYVRALNDHHPKLPRRVWAVQAGTAVSHRVRGGIENSVNVIRHAPAERQCVIERWDYRQEVQAFRLMAHDVAALDRSSGR